MKSVSNNANAEFHAKTAHVTGSSRQPIKGLGVVILGSVSTLRNFAFG